jgi:hypothetical protein
MVLDNHTNIALLNDPDIDVNYIAYNYLTTPE